MNKNTARKAAKWWADHLRNPAILDNGDQSKTGGMTFALASILQRSKMSDISEEQSQSFEDKLAENLENIDNSYYCFGVDYHPDMILAETARDVGIDVDTVLPWKTNMWIDGDKVEVAQGYQAPIKEI